MKILEQGGGASSATGARARITIISPGQGSSGYYPCETVAEAAPLFTKGMHMYLDHATESERAERGVRSLEKLVAVFESDAELGPNGALLADVKIMPAWQPFVREAYPYIGVSISASGEVEESEYGRTITRLTAVESVDFVTKAGRGGKIDALLESALPPHEPTHKEEPVSVITLTESEHKALEEAANANAANTEKIAKLEKQIAELQAELEKEKAKAATSQAEATAAKESAVRAEASTILEEAFAGIEAPVGKARLLEAVNPTEFDAETFRVTVTEAAAEYAPSTSPVHGVGKTTPTTVTVTESDITKEFGGRI